MQDAKSGLYRITWASDVEGWFSETPSPSGFNNRTYQVTTRDFINFGTPALMIEPGFEHVDANIIPWRGPYLALFKQGDDVKAKVWGTHYAATATKVEGPYQLIPTPIISGQRADVVAVVVVGDRLIYYVNRHAPRQLLAYSTGDGEKWTDISDTISRALAPSQGCILTVPTALFNSLLSASGAPVR